MRPFDEGEFIVRYTGILCSIEEFNAGFKAGQTSGDYIFLIGDSNLLIDAEDPEQSSAARYINHSVRRANCALRDVCTSVNWFGTMVRIPLGVVYVKATKRIAQGQEILTDYGTVYWDSRATGLRRFVIDYW